MRKFFATALACVTLSACNTLNWSPVLSASGTLASALAVPACARLSRTASTPTKCVNAASLWAIAPSAISYLSGIDWNQYIGATGAFFVSCLLMLAMCFVAGTRPGSKS